MGAAKTGWKDELSWHLGIKKGPAGPWGGGKMDEQQKCEAARPCELEGIRELARRGEKAGAGKKPVSIQ